MKLFQCAVLFRLFLLLSATLYGLTGLTQPETLVYRIANEDAIGPLWMAAMVVFSGLGLIDLVVNDLMPERFVIRRALRDRHLVNGALAICFAVQMFLSVKYRMPAALLPYYLLFVVFIPLSAFADVHKRYRKGCK